MKTYRCTQWFYVQGEQIIFEGTVMVASDPNELPFPRGGTWSGFWQEFKI